VSHAPATPTEQELRAELTGPVTGAGRQIHARGVWLAVDDPAFHLPRQGWKIHLSARPATLQETIRRMLPAVLAVPCHFKVVRSGRHLQDLNSANNHPGSIGKAVTIYPSPEDVAPLARRLAEDLAGMEGPRICSDRRVRPDAPVYYRYGPFHPCYDINDDGDLELVVTDPQGNTHPGAADDSFWQPHWSPDPLTGATPHPAPSDGPAAPVLLGGRYRVVRGLTRNGKGCVYRAIDTTDNRPVIIKEARAHVNEDALGRDSRLRLRNERYVLHLLRDLDDVPKVIDHFRHEDREYLAITDLGALALGQDVAENGLYVADPAPPGRSLRALATALLELLDHVHRRGVLVRDLTPTNVVLDDATGRPRLVDFEISHAEDPQLYGWTPGYSPPEQERDEPATVEADYYSLGATLFYAATGLPPTWMTGDPGNHDPRRAAEVLAGRGGMSGTILGLLDPDPARRRAAADDIRAGRFTDAPPPPPPSARQRARRLEAAIAHSLTELSRHAADLMSGKDFTGGLVGSPINLYRGAAGMGMELLRHDEPSRALARGLAYWTGGFRALRNGRPGLYTGDTGIAVFIAEAGATLGDETLLKIAEPLARPVLSRITATDQHTGLAGIGTGQLLLWRLTKDAGRLELADACARRLLARDLTAELQENPPDYADCGAVSRTLGFAHGLAGIVHFLRDHHAATGETATEAALHKGCDTLLEHLPPLLEAARAVSAKPMHASFCQGLAGIGAALARTGRDLGADDHLQAAREAAAACLELAPRMYALTQCCGLAGIGELFLDLCQITGDRTYAQWADRIADLILARAGGSPEAPVFPDTSLHGSSGGWSIGTSGVVSFLRRLGDPAAPRLWLDPPAGTAR